MDWEAAIAAAVRVAVAGRTEAREDRWASDDEIDRRRQEGLCLRCGQHGHFVRDCRAKKKPQDKNKKRTRVAAAKTRRAKKASPQKDEDKDGDDESSFTSDESSGKE
jgi:hypothetical protein